MLLVRGVVKKQMLQLAIVIVVTLQADDLYNQCATMPDAILYEHVTAHERAQYNNYNWGKLTII